jgi:hypothetical protein
MQLAWEHTHMLHPRHPGAPGHTVNRSVAAHDPAWAAPLHAGGKGDEVRIAEVLRRDVGVEVEAVWVARVLALRIRSRQDWTRGGKRSDSVPITRLGTAAAAHTPQSRRDLRGRYGGWSSGWHPICISFPHAFPPNPPHTPRCLHVPTARLYRGSSPPCTHSHASRVRLVPAAACIGYTAHVIPPPPSLLRPGTPPGMPRRILQRQWVLLMAPPERGPLS